MAEFTLPHFGPINMTSLEDYYDVAIEFKGGEIQIDLNFDNKTIDHAQINAVKVFIENIEKLDNQNKIYIENDYKDEDGDTVRFYLEHHLEELNKEELSTLIDFNNKSVEPEKQLMNRLTLVRVGLYPDNDEYFATFDYSLGVDISNYLVVINTDIEGNLYYMTMES